MGDVLQRCSHIEVPAFIPKRKLPGLNLYALQRLLQARSIQRTLKNTEANIVFATQPSWLNIKQAEKRYDFMYNVRDLFTYPTLLNTTSRSLGDKQRGMGLQWRAYFFMLSKLRYLLIGKPKVKRFIALSDLIYRDLLATGIKNAEMIFPPARLDLFHPRPKKRQIVLTCRIDPAKNLDLFFKIASELPLEKFYLVGRDNTTTRLAHPKYAERIFSKKPSNVEFINSPIKEVRQVLEESLVYLYTGIEPGIGIAIMEGCGAGCIPMAPHIGGGSEIVKALGAGETFTSWNDGVRKLKNILDNPSPSPQAIREMALKAFNPDVFAEKIRALL